MQIPRASSSRALRSRNATDFKRRHLAIALLFVLGPSTESHGAVDDTELAELRIAVVDDADGSSLAARVRIAEAGAAGAMRRMAGGDDRVVLVDGARTVRVPAGTYRVVASHGPKYTLLDRTVEVTAGAPVEVRASLRRVVRARGYAAADLHLHTDASPDGRVAAAERRLSLAAEDIDFAVATDHNVVTELVAEDMAAGLVTVAGVEITTWEPEIGHFNAFPVASAPEHRGRTPDELFDELHRDPRTLVQINHPRLEDSISYFALGELRPGGVTREGFGFGADLIELLNGYDLGRPDRVMRLIAEWMDVLASGETIVASGGSDSHTLDRQPVGWPRTYVRIGDGPATLEAITEALRAGRAFVSSGPFVDATVFGRAPGEFVRARMGGTLPLDVRVEAPPFVDVDSIEVRFGREVVARVGVPASRGAVRFDGTIRVPLRAAGALVVVVRGDEPMEALFPHRRVTPLAVTNPIWVLR